MVPIQVDKIRQDILDSVGHLLIEGGPGCGKTTIALLKARRCLDDLAPDQRVLFLSFSRAAVRQVTERIPGIIERQYRDAIEVKTFHAFFLDIVRSQARLLTGLPARFITPGREALRRSDFEGLWEEERARLALQESVFVFDTLAPTAASLLENWSSVRALYSSMYPIVIVDEFQDTNVDQWRVVKALSDFSTVVCLADPDQRIFDHLPGVDDERLGHALKHLSPTTFDLSRDNHRSPESGLLPYANAVLRNHPSPVPDGVKTISYQYKRPELVAHYAVLALRDILSEKLGSSPTIAVLTRANVLAGRISEALGRDEFMDNGKALPAVDHMLHWDPELTAAAGLVVASILEWPLQDQVAAVTSTLATIVDYYRVKVGQGTIGAKKTIITLERAAEAVLQGETVRSKATKQLIAAYDAALLFSGSPVSDWQVARSLLTKSTELEEIFRQARLLRLLKATDALAWALLDTWDGSGGYPRAVASVRTALANETLNGASQDPPIINVMTMHKSKGKEFDGVVIVEDPYGSPLLGDHEDSKQEQGSRRLLRVAITRARHFVVFVRPFGASPLTPSEEASS